ncbi:MAG: hypothetical protein U0984_09455 [Prosthecobacter sp.]|nr:hypothetical protein [Prosthecobacter sp.]
MNLPVITWKGEGIDDIEILPNLPHNLLNLLAETNGFILHSGALHVRGATTAPDWHSLRAAWHGTHAFHILYEAVQSSDIPFAQDQVGDQFLTRDCTILRLEAETGEIEPVNDSLEDFFDRVRSDISGFLNVGLSHTMEPGQLLRAVPPFCLQGSADKVSLRPSPATEVILWHAELAKQIRHIPDGEQVEIKWTN